MAPASLLVSVAVLAAMAPCPLGRRQKITDVLHVQRNTSECPPGNSARRDAKGACVDEQSAPVDADCCWCPSQLQEVQAETLTRLTTYRKKCVNKHQLARKKDGTFVVKDTSTLCGESCQSLPLLQAPHSVNIAALKARCPGQEEAINNLENMMASVQAMDKAWQSCSSEADCPAEFGDCTKSHCCDGPGLTCYEKDDYYAQCLTSCGDGPDYEGWTCKSLSPGGASGGGRDGSEEGTVDTTTKVLGPYGGAKNIVYVLQRSSTMWTHWYPCSYSKYMFGAIDIINEVLMLDSTTRVNAIVFDNDPVALDSTSLLATRKNKEKLANFLKTEAPRDDTWGLLKWRRYWSNLGKALDKAFEVPGVDAVVLLSDGTRDDAVLLSDDAPPVYAKLLKDPRPRHLQVPVDSGSPEGPKILGDIARTTKGEYYDWAQHEKGCPKIMGDTLTVKDGGTSSVNGNWHFLYTWKNKPSYARYVYHDPTWTEYDPFSGMEFDDSDVDYYSIQWDGQKWTLTQNIVWPWSFSTLYINYKDSDLVPTDGWYAVGGHYPVPTIEEYMATPNTTA